MNYRVRAILKSFFVVICLFLVGCASEAEKQERKENSFDISGDYKVSRSQGSEIDMNFSIRNESGRHDIVVEVERLSIMTEKETSFLKAQGIDANLVSAHFTNKFLIGQGYDSRHPEGGENISSDFGENSKFYVCSKKFKYNQEYQVSYCLTGQVQKNTQVMTGQLSVVWNREKKVKVNQEEKTEFTSGTLGLSYKSDMSLVFYKQYFGTWSGQVHSLAGADFNGDFFKNITIRSHANETFSVVGSNSPSFQYKNETFFYDLKNNQLSLEFLKNPSYPAIQMVFVSAAGKRIVMFGQIWSLGQLSGSITMILSDRQIDLATFRMKKN